MSNRTNSFILKLFGLPMKEAQEAVEESKWLSWRIVRMDSDHYIVTHDLRTDRVNFEIDNGIVTNAYIG